ncbi:MAG: hypothetical protein CMK72_05220 [Pseudomonadaceae bacterium]|nr:hypothetical protein [Pseudomonadaceae bacterium]HCP54049.1 hypothetical protein [Pseudomonas sp.]
MKAEAINALLNSNSTIFTIGTLLVISGFAIKFLRGAFDFHNEYFISRQLNRLVRLRSAVGENPELESFIKGLAEEEVFRVATGIKAPPNKVKALIQLHRSGAVTKIQLRQFNQYLRLNNSGDLYVHFRKIDRAFAHYSRVSGIFVLVLTLIGSTPMIIHGSVSTLLAGVLISIFGAFGSRLLLRDFTVYRQLQKLQMQLPQLAVDVQTPKTLSASSAPLPTAQQPR